MPYVVTCSRCGTPVPYDVPDEADCRCGWSYVVEMEEEFEESVRERCDERGFDYRALRREIGDADIIDGFLDALDRDD